MKVSIIMLTTALALSSPFAMAQSGSNSYMQPPSVHR